VRTVIDRDRIAEIGDAVEVRYPPEEKIRLGMVKEVREGVVTILIGGGQAHCVVAVKPERLAYLGPGFWQIAMRG
jgi:hypothetical protein